MKKLRGAGPGLKIVLALGLLGAPALAEAHARTRLDEGLAARGVDASEVDIGPLGFHAKGLRARAGGKAVRLGELSVRPSLDGIRVQIRDVQMLESADPVAAPVSSEAHAPEADEIGRWRPVEKLRSVARRFRGIPVNVQIEGEFSLSDLSPSPELLGGEITRIEAQLRSDGHIEGQTHARVLVSDRPYQLELDFGTSTESMAPLRVQGELREERLGKIAVQAEADHDRFAARVELEDGRMDLRGQGLVDSSGAEAQLSFESFPVGDLAALVDDRVERLGIDVAWDELALDGSSSLTRSADGWRGEARELTLSGLSVESRYLSRRRVRFDDLVVDADLRRHAAGHSAVLSVSHKAAAVQFSGEHTDEGLALAADLAPISCQDFLDAAPRGLFTVLEGMQLRGELEGRASLQTRWAQLDTWVAEQEAAKREVRMPDESVRPPGETEFEFPLLERCRVTREAPGLSVDKVKGAYRHRFTGTDGREHQRVLAPGAPNFASMASARDFSRAFTILEDARFWVHDGFDREHIERALWHDLSVGAMARGASTITQQTSRNLWLGLDRSVSRKLQEAFLAARLEKEVGKRRIMEIYMNIIELGPEVYGIEEAAQFYFGRPARDLNLLEALHIASLAPSPVRLGKRFEDGTIDEQWRAHLEEQVRRLRIHGFITREQARQAKRLEVALLDRRATPPN